MMAATFNGNPRATIVSCYSPTNVSKETKLVRSIPKHNLLVIGGDMNAQIGKTETTNTAFTRRQIGIDNIQQNSW